MKLWRRVCPEPGGTIEDYRGWLIRLRYLDWTFHLDLEGEPDGRARLMIRRDCEPSPLTSPLLTILPGDTVNCDHHMLIPPGLLFDRFARTVLWGVIAASEHEACEHFLADGAVLVNPHADGFASMLLPEDLIHDG